MKVSAMNRTRAPGWNSRSCGRSSRTPPPGPRCARTHHRVDHPGAVDAPDPVAGEFRDVDVARDGLDHRPERLDPAGPGSPGCRRRPGRSTGHHARSARARPRGARSAAASRDGGGGGGRAVAASLPVELPPGSPSELPSRPAPAALPASGIPVPFRQHRPAHRSRPRPPDPRRAPLSSSRRRPGRRATTRGGPASSPPGSDVVPSQRAPSRPCCAALAGPTIC